MCLTSLARAAAQRVYLSIPTTPGAALVTAPVSSVPSTPLGLQKRSRVSDPLVGPAVCLLTVVTANDYLLTIHNEPGAGPALGARLTVLGVIVPCIWNVLCSSRDRFDVVI